LFYLTQRKTKANLCRFEKLGSATIYWIIFFYFYLFIYIFLSKKIEIN